MKFKELVEEANNYLKKGKLKKCLDFLDQFVVRGTPTDNDLITISGQMSDHSRKSAMGLVDHRDEEVSSAKFSERILSLLAADRKRDFSAESMGEVSWEKVFNHYQDQFSLRETQNVVNEHLVYISPPYSIHWRLIPEDKRHQYHTLERELQKDYLPSAKITSIGLDVHLGNWLIDGEYRRNNEFQYSYQKLILILGKPGAGKTTLCRNLIWKHYRSRQGEQNHLVFYLKLVDLKASPEIKEDFLKSICDHLSNDIRCKVNFDLEQEVFFILDGFDELITREGYTQEEAKDILTSILEELRGLQNICILITCRTEYIDLNFGIERGPISAYKLEPFSKAEQDLWFEQYIKVSANNSFSTERFARIRNESPLSVQELFDQPLLLALIAKDPQLIAENVINQSGVFKKLIESVIDREWDERSAYLRGFSKKDILNALQAVAFKMSKNSRGNSLPKDEVLRSWEEFLPKEEIEIKREGEELLNLLVGNFYLRRIVASGISEELHVEFVHNSFREYLTAEYLLKEAIRKYANKNADTSLQWLSVTFGEISPTNAIVDFLIELIDYQDQSVLDLLAQQMESELDQLLLQDFIDLTSQQLNTPPIRNALQALYFFWIIYGHSKKKDLRAGGSIQANTRFKELIRYVVKVSQDTSYRLNFNGSNLTKLDLSGCHLDRADFENSILTKSRFDACSISNTVFDGANLRGCSMKGSHLRQTTFQNGIREDYDDYKEEVNTSEKPTDLQGGDFRFAEIENVDFEGAVLTDCKFHFASLQDVRLTIEQIQASDLSGARVTDPHWLDQQLSYGSGESEDEYLLGMKILDHPMSSQQGYQYYLLISEKDGRQADEL